MRSAGARPPGPSLRLVSTTAIRCYFCWLCCLVSTGLAAKRGHADPDRFDARTPSLPALRSGAPERTQQLALEELLERLLPGRASEMMLLVNSSMVARGHGEGSRDVFRLESLPDGRLLVAGSSAVAGAYGLHHYLKEYCGCHLGWAGRQLKVPRPLPRVGGAVQVVSPNRFRFYQNVRTRSYSMVWWQWERWELEIDWMALQGINLPLAFTGHEAIWQRVFLSLGLSQKEMDDYFTGPAFLAWSQLGDLHAWAGPLPQSWHHKQLHLQRKILERMRSLGMITVLPAFEGYVPAAVARLYPKANLIRLSSWDRFDCNYSCPLWLDPHDPLFPKLASAYMKELRDEFGSDHAYYATMFSELMPPSNLTADLAGISRAVYKAMTAVDSEAVWLLDTWPFLGNPNFWQEPQLRAFLRGPPLGRVLVLDVFAETRPLHHTTDSFYGQPFIWCMLHNFGGNHGLFGAIESVNRGPHVARLLPNSSMVGTGMAPEGIEQNDVVYELMAEMGWRDGPVDLTIWIESYAHRRYGQKDADVAAAWKDLWRSVYNCTEKRENRNQSPLVVRPSLTLDTSLWYDPALVYSAWARLVRAVPRLGTSLTFRYDLIDVTRQALQLLSGQLYRDLLAAYEGGSVEELLLSGGMLSYELFPDLENLLSSDERFLLGRWLLAAAAHSDNASEAELYQLNARYQITLWGPTGNRLDVANKLWGGLVSYYYTPRWKMFVSTLTDCVHNEKPFNKRDFDNACFQLEKSFVLDDHVFPVKARGDTYEIINRIFLRYYHHIQLSVSPLVLPV
ncbi:alpha-N-acetylglucosaminidase-like [Lampetra planeri]